MAVFNSDTTIFMLSILIYLIRCCCWRGIATAKCTAKKISSAPAVVCRGYSWRGIKHGEHIRWSLVGVCLLRFVDSGVKGLLGGCCTGERESTSKAREWISISYTLHVVTYSEDNMSIKTVHKQKYKSIKQRKRKKNIIHLKSFLLSKKKNNQRMGRKYFLTQSFFRSLMMFAVIEV